MPPKKQKLQQTEAGPSTTQQPDVVQPAVEQSTMEQPAMEPPVATTVEAPFTTIYHPSYDNLLCYPPDKKLIDMVMNYTDCDAQKCGNLTDSSQREAFRENQLGLMLGMADTVHDFWPGRGASKMEVEKVHEILGMEVFNKLYEKNANNNLRPNVLLTSLIKCSGDPIPETGVEENTISFFEKATVLSKYVLPDKVIKVDYDAFKKMSDDQLAQYNVITVVDNNGNGSTFKNVSTHLEEVGNKIAKFFGREDLYLTYDAGQPTMSKIVAACNKLSRVFTPQNMADSAGTKAGDESSKDYYHFSVRPPDGDIGKSFLASSNYYTKKDFNLVYRDHGFGMTHPSGFTLEVSTKENPPLKTSTLSYHKANGPSVNYLYDFILGKKPSGQKIVDLFGGLKAIFGEYKQLNVDDKNLLTRLLFDFKREGDYGQIEACHSYNYDSSGGDKMGNGVLVTIDRLCSLKARLRGLNTVLSVNKGSVLHLYKMGKPQTPEEVAASYTKKYREFFYGYSTGTKIPKDYTEHIVVLRTIADYLSKWKSDSTKRPGYKVTALPFHPITEQLFTKRCDEMVNYINQFIGLIEKLQDPASIKPILPEEWVILSAKIKSEIDQKKAHLEEIKSQDGLSAELEMVKSSISTEPIPISDRFDYSLPPNLKQLNANQYLELFLTKVVFEWIVEKTFTSDESNNVFGITPMEFNQLLDDIYKMRDKLGSSTDYTKRQKMIPFLSFHYSDYTELDKQIKELGKMVNIESKMPEDFLEVMNRYNEELEEIQKTFKKEDPSIKSIPTIHELVNDPHMTHHSYYVYFDKSDNKEECSTTPTPISCKTPAIRIRDMARTLLLAPKKLKSSYNALLNFMKYGVNPAGVGGTLTELGIPVELKYDDEDSRLSADGLREKYWENEYVPSTDKEIILRAIQSTLPNSPSTDSTLFIPESSTYTYKNYKEDIANVFQQGSENWITLEDPLRTFGKYEDTLFNDVTFLEHINSLEGERKKFLELSTKLLFGYRDKLRVEYDAIKQYRLWLFQQYYQSRGQSSAVMRKKCQACSDKYRRISYRMYKMLYRMTDFCQQYTSSTVFTYKPLDFSSGESALLERQNSEIDFYTWICKEVAEFSRSYGIDVLSKKKNGPACTLYIKGDALKAFTSHLTTIINGPTNILSYHDIEIQIANEMIHELFLKKPENSSIVTITNYPASVEQKQEGGAVGEKRKMQEEPNNTEDTEDTEDIEEEVVDRNQYRISTLFDQLYDYFSQASEIVNTLCYSVSHSHPKKDVLKPLVQFHRFVIESCNLQNKLYQHTLYKKSDHSILRYTLSQLQELSTSVDNGILTSFYEKSPHSKSNIEQLRGFAVYEHTPISELDIRYHELHDILAALNKDLSVFLINYYKNPQSVDLLSLFMHTIHQDSDAQEWMVNFRQFLRSFKRVAKYEMLYEILYEDLELFYHLSLQKSPLPILYFAYLNDLLCNKAGTHTYDVSTGQLLKNRVSTSIVEYLFLPTMDITYHFMSGKGVFRYQLIKQTTPDVVNEYQDDEKSTPPPSEMNVSNGAPQAGSGLDDPSETSASNDERVAVASTIPLTQDGPLQRLYDEIDYRMKNIIFLPDFRKYTEDLSDLQFVLRLTEESEDATRLRYLADRSEMETAEITAPVNPSIVVEEPMKEHTEEMKVEQLPPTKPVYKIMKPLTPWMNTRKTERLPFSPVQTDTSTSKIQIAPAAAAAGGNRIKKTRKHGKMTPKKQKKWRAIRQTKQRLERTYHRRSRHHIKK